jgi:hypothetical protein
MLFDFDIENLKRLGEECFTENERWTKESIRVLEDSNKPVLVMVNSKKNKKILVIEELSDIMILEPKISEIHVNKSK